MDDLEYIVTGALTHCSKGAGIMPISVSSNTTTHVQKLLVATDSDKTYMVNIPNYGMCNTTQKPCHPIPTMWTDTYDKVKVNGSHPLIGKSCLHCAVDPSSEIKFITSGQLPLEWSLSKESLEAINKANQQANEASDEYDLERKSVGESGFWEGFIPVWGSGRDYVHSIQTKHYWKAVGNLGLVALDIFTLGADELIIGAVKGGAKGLAEAGGKMALKKIAGIIAAKEAAILLAKKFAITVSEFSLREAGLCIAKACFVAGTPVRTANGLKNIEKLVSGDEVWAYNEETSEIGLKSVLNVFERQADTIVELTVGGEIILTTPEHPFYANSNWKEAGLLEPGDTIQLFNGNAAIVQKKIFKFDRELLPAVHGADTEKEEMSYRLNTVYNIEVEEWHTYFVGTQCLLVHNTVCLAKVLEEISAGAKKMREILLGRTPGKASATGRKVIERMEKENRILRDEEGVVTHFKSTKDGKWYPIDRADMAHKEDAVTWWNKNADKYQARSPEVRKFMRDPDNYYLELDSYNRSDGSILGKTNKYNLPSK